MAKHKGSIDTRIQHRIRRLPPGSIFTPSDLTRYGSRTAVASALSRAHRGGLIRQVARGLYYVPQHHPVLGELRPSVDAIAEALAGKGHFRLQPAGAHAANLLGLSEQVPLRVIYLTDGTPRRVRLGKLEIVLKRTTPKNMASAGRISGMVIQALRHLGRRHVDRQEIDHLRRRLLPRDKRILLRDAQLAPAWIAAIMREVAAPGEK